MLKRFVLPIAVVYTVFLTVISFISIGDIPNLGTDYDDKIYHIIAYIALTVLWFMTFKAPVIKIKIMYLGLFCVIFGIIIEAIQGKVNVNRVGDLLDVVANIIGVLIGLVYCLKTYKKLS